MYKTHVASKKLFLWILTFLLVLPTSSHTFSWSGLLSDLYNHYYGSQSTTTKIVIPTTIAAIIGGSWWLSSYLARQREAERLRAERQQQEEERLLTGSRRITIERNQQRLQQAEQTRPQQFSSASLSDQDINSITSTTNTINMQLSPNLSNDDFENIAGQVNSIVYAYPQLQISEITPEIINKPAPIRYNITKSIIYQIINKALENKPEELAAFRIGEIYNVINPRLNTAINDSNNTTQAYNLMLNFLDYNPYNIAPQQERTRGELATALLGLKNPRFAANAMSRNEWLQQMRNPRPAIQVEPITQEESQHYTEQLLNIYTLP